jgi:hypothetical protein
MTRPPALFMVLSMLCLSSCGVDWVWEDAPTYNDLHGRIVVVDSVNDLVSTDLSGTPVSISNQSGNFMSNTTADRFGNWSISGVPKGKMSVTVDLPNYSTSGLIAEVPGSWPADTVISIIADRMLHTLAIDSLRADTSHVLFFAHDNSIGPNTAVPWRVLFVVDTLPDLGVNDRHFLEEVRTPYRDRKGEFIVGSPQAAELLGSTVDTLYASVYLINSREQYAYSGHPHTAGPRSNVVAIPIR